MNAVAEQIVTYYQRMEQAQSEEERMRIKQARQDYYDHLSKADQKIAREAAAPFLEKLIRQIEQEVDPLLERLDEVLERTETRKAHNAYHRISSPPITAPNSGPTTGTQA